MCGKRDLYMSQGLDKSSKKLQHFGPKKKYTRLCKVSPVLLVGMSQFMEHYDLPNVWMELYKLLTKQL